MQALSFVPLGYEHPKLQQLEESIGGGPYGAGCVVGGDGSVGPRPAELEIAEYQGEQFAKYLKK